MRKISSISDFNWNHPPQNKIKVLFTHIYNSWSVVKYIEKNIKGLDGNTNIYALLWENDIDKLGIIKYYFKNVKLCGFTPILGKTQRIHKSSIESLEKETICIFDEDVDISRKLEILSPFSIKKYNSLFLDYLEHTDKNIRNNLKELRNEGDAMFLKFNSAGSSIKKTEDTLLFLGLIYKIKNKYQT